MSGTSQSSSAKVQPSIDRLFTPIYPVDAQYKTDDAGMLILPSGTALEAYKAEKVNEENEYVEATRVFEDIVEHYIETLTHGTDLGGIYMNALQIDKVGLTCMLKRFQRDAFGIKHFCQFTDSLVQQEKIVAETQDHLNSFVHNLGLRISTDAPRHTRIAAAFSLWMCVFRPVSFDINKLSPVLQLKSVELFCASLNYFIACSYLAKFGKVFMHELPDADTRLKRVRHDFTYRHVSLSTLETFYCSIFRVRNKEGESAQ